MADYWLTFRIHQNSTYQTRYDALIEAVNDNGTGFWDGPTSFIALRSGKSIDTLGKAYKDAIDPAVDLFVIREIGVDSTRYAGKPGTGFESFFPKAKKL
jgi:hypothetical protein